MCAITLARIEATSAVDSLRSSLEQLSLEPPFGYACAWAIWQLTGEEIPTVNPRIKWQRNWFLVPTAED